MRKSQTKRPVRRKPDRRSIQYKYSTVERYQAPKSVTLYALFVVAALIGIPALMAMVHLGWFL